MVRIVTAASPAIFVDCPPHPSHVTPPASGIDAVTRYTPPGKNTTPPPAATAAAWAATIAERSSATPLPTAPYVRTLKNVAENAAERFVGEPLSRTFQSAAPALASHRSSTTSR